MRFAITYMMIAILITVLNGCSGGETQNERNISKKDYKEPLMEANRHVVRTEDQHIEDFLRRYKWQMHKNGSGLRYMIIEEGEGSRAEKGLMATIDYTIRVITGDIVYTSEEKGPLTFIIGKGEVISGLEEGILLMNVGDKAKFIIPSHLAYGLVGDGDLIPGKATLIYDIELLNLNKTN